MATTQRTEARRLLIAELVKLQNQHDSQDILTITGFMDDAQVAAHVARYRELVSRRAANGVRS